MIGCERTVCSKEDERREEDGGDGGVDEALADLGSIGSSPVPQTLKARPTQARK